MRFIDVTDHPPTVGANQLIVTDKIPDETSYGEEVQRFIDDLDTTNMEEWGQHSIIARFKGTNPDLDNEVVILGAQLDSVNQWMPPTGRSPGADDDGSGTVTILEAFRSLVFNGFEPERPVEFHWYSAEKRGCWENHMTGYIGDQGEVIGIVTDYIDGKVTKFIATLVDAYASISYVLTECGYACSDHASWGEYGYPSAFIMESKVDASNRDVRTKSDTIDKLSFDHMKELAKVDIGFAVELSHQRE
ncbi:lap2 protein [Lichtheimia corymbifera JMRC:FSU:9682]|uniref:Peptide hydrolase n=1 Tax=Lichtheimia corymbifera JMRC:FSU:9682 TaxID=1263082 RepID=A0A068RPV4_9FUNG|nr:lap2 protein [Lichtheimia corymbifera JMRC:FSU:9682]